MDKLISKIVNIFINEKIITPDEEEVYYYCIETVFSLILFYGVIFLIAIFSDNLLITLFYYLGFLGIRFTSGGYHLSTHMQCYIMSILIFILSLFIINLMPKEIYPYCIGIIYFLAIPVIFGLAPVDHVNRRFSAEEYKKLKTKSKLMIIILFFVVIGLYGIQTQLSWAISCGVCCATISFSLAWIKERREKNYGS